MKKNRIKSIVESLIFVSERPISLGKIYQVLDREEREVIRAAVMELVEEYSSSGRGYTLYEVAGGYQFRSIKENSLWVKKLYEAKPHRLSQAALETLAIVAYRQPVVRSEVEKIRGVDSGGVIKALLERNLVKILGRKEAPGRPVIYGTTPEFLEFFGLKNLSNLPSLREIKELGNAAEALADYAPREEEALGKKEE